MSFVHDTPPMMRYRQNKSPSAGALGDWFALRTYFLTSEASPNDSGIVIIVVIIVIGEAKLVLHRDGIIAQTYFSSGDLSLSLESGSIFERITIPGRLPEPLRLSDPKTARAD